MLLLLSFIRIRISSRLPPMKMSSCQISDHYGSEQNAGHFDDVVSFLNE
jgi:hypothetical protein